MTAKKSTTRLRMTLFPIILTILLAGCNIMTWQPVTEARLKTADGVSMDLPSGWMRSGDSLVNGIVVSRDGVALQLIRMERLPHDRAFKPLSRQSSADMLPSELAELTIAFLKAQDGMENLDVIEEAPATVVGHQGFRLLVGIKNPKGLRYERLTYGFADEKGVCLLTYMAPVLYYFQRDLGVFEQIVHSISM